MSNNQNVNGIQQATKCNCASTPLSGVNGLSGVYFQTGETLLKMAMGGALAYFAHDHIKKVIKKVS